MNQPHRMDREEFYTEVTKRSPLLEAVREEARTLKQLDDTLAMSRSTIHRAIQSFEEQGLLRKEGTHYALTGFGRAVAREAAEFRDRLSTVHRLDDFLNVVDPGTVDVPYEHLGDASVTRPKPRQAHVGSKRIIDLIEAADSLRMISNIISPLYVDVALGQMIEGTEIEVIFDTTVMEIVADEYVEQARRAFETGRFTVYVAASVPFELFLADGKMAMAAHDSPARPHVVVESESPEAVEWATDVYRAFRERADEVDVAGVDAFDDPN